MKILPNKGFWVFVCICFMACENTKFPQGKVLYELNCSTCHMPDGSGVAKLYPALNQLEKESEIIDNLPCIIRYGQDKPENLLEMAGVSNLTSIEINNIINYLVNDINRLSMDINIDKTKQELENCPNAK